MISRPALQLNLFCSNHNKKLIYPSLEHHLNLNFQQKASKMPAPTQQQLDLARNEIVATMISREPRLAKAYAEHPDPDAWYLNFINCLAKAVAGPPASSSDAPDLTAAAQAEEVNKHAVGSNNATQSVAACGVKRRRVEDGNEDDNVEILSVVEVEAIAQNVRHGHEKERTDLNERNNSEVQEDDDDMELRNLSTKSLAKGKGKRGTEDESERPAKKRCPRRRMFDVYEESDSDYVQSESD
ncbi:hypothetical protein B0T20DRAFT_473824 [Sordaria brevicollis]|uniref:Uncharacterized protein n=1 Tax=Sordaria brevicollis TaxID=83679 RepID=A0AAE0U2E8_SORBR|nr:hypothetical protein B0T20DRAFT_473824 [Sordaria brevicollis]